MHYIGQFDPTQMGPSNGIAKNSYIGVNIADAGQKVLFTNLAPVNIQLNFEDGTTAILHAGQANYWVVQNPTPVIEWTQQLVLNISGSAVNMCTVVVYDRDEPVVGTYPISLVYFTIVGNQNGVSTSLSNLVNDGSTLGTSIVEVTPTGQSASGITLSNEGVLALNVLISGTYHQSIKTSKLGAVLYLGNATDYVETLGAFYVDGALNANTALNVTGATTLSSTLNVTGTTTVGTLNATTTTTTNLRVSGGNLYGADASNTVFSTSGSSGTGKTRVQNTDVVSLQVPIGTDMMHVNSTGVFVDSSLDLQGNPLKHVNSIVDSGGTSWMSITAGSTVRLQSTSRLSFQVPVGTEVANVQSNGMYMGTGASLFLQTGSFTHVSHGTYANAGTGGVTINHGLPTTPDIVIAMCTSGPSTSTYSTGTYGSTSFVLYPFSGGLNWVWMAIKF